MRLKNKIQLFPFCFFMFLANFVLIEFIFIFFFNASFAPPFIFELTPLYYLSGMSNLQLLFLSLCVVIINAYLHTKETRKNLIRSFIPTAIMIAGVVGVMISQEFTITYLPYYILFASLLVSIMIDHNRILLMSIETDMKKTRIKKEKILPSKKPEKHIFTKIRSATYYFKRDKKGTISKSLDKDEDDLEKNDNSFVETINIEDDEIKKPLQKEKTKDIHEDIDKLLNIKK